MSERTTSEIVADLRDAIGAGIYRGLTIEAADRLAELDAKATMTPLELWKVRNLLAFLAGTETGPAQVVKRVAG